MATTFGDVARRADEHLAAAIFDIQAAAIAPGSHVSSADVAAIAGEIGRLAAIMSSCILVAGDSGPQTHPWARAAITTRADLRLAAQALPAPNGASTTHWRPVIYPMPPTHWRPGADLLRSHLPGGTRQRSPPQVTLDGTGHLAAGHRGAAV